MIIDDYINYEKEYKKIYGENCIILMQVGSFYELYSITDNQDSFIHKITDICNIQVSRKNKTLNDISINNPLMAGFPLHSLNKFTPLLLNNNYTIVLIEQITEPPNPERKVTNILSPGMNIEVNSKKNNYMIVLYFEFIDNNLIVGISGIDISCGNTIFYETSSTKSKPDFATDEVYRLLLTYSPTELIILSKENIPDNIKKDIMRNINSNNILVHYKWNNCSYLENMTKLKYQKQILEKAYENKKSLISIIEVLNLEKYDVARISFCCLLQFAYEHNVDLIKKLNIPLIIENNKILNIEYNSSIQLNILGLYDGDKPLIDILNRCSTAFGSRIYKERLLSPIIDVKELNKRYDEIDFLLKDNKFELIDKKLKCIKDLERIKRKIILSKFAPMEWLNFNSSLENSIDCIKLINNSSHITYDNIINDISNLIIDYNKKLDINIANKYNINDIKSNIFKIGIYKDIDNYQEEYNKSINNINNIVSSINNLDEYGDTTSCKIEFNDREGYYILITKKRYEKALSISKVFMNNFNKKSLSSSSTSLKLTNNIINEESLNIEKYLNLISTLTTKYYKEFLNNFIKEYNDILDNLINIITNLDITCCNAKNAFEYRYYKPIINDKNNNTSYINAINIRHPIVERINDDIKYVGNDIELSNNGILLYGINASGKSTLMKTIGLNIIMAQSGMYVPSDNMEYFPYHHIFTRISGMDNIYKGLSSFTVEMTELRNILKRSNKNSLVLGDEICCGTESVSAIAIVSAGIDSLVKNRSSFIFATHLHELIDISLIKDYIDNNDILVNHMHISIDNDIIIYDRVLKEGSGSSVYGIEVCKSLDMPTDFLKIAENIRKEFQGYDKSFINIKESIYNKKVIMDLCHICKNKAIDTHHIEYQSNADKNGFINTFHKNNKHNLVPLCKECHIKQHNGNSTIEGYIQTSKGIILKKS